MIIWVRVVLKKKAVDNNDISTTCAAVVFRVKGSYITSVDGIIRLFEYGKSRSEDITLLRCMYTIFTCMLRSGIHIHFLSESLAGQVSLMAYLPSCNLGCLDK